MNRFFSIPLMAVIAFTGCVGIKYQAQIVTPVVVGTNSRGAPIVGYLTNNVAISADRLMWSTDSYAAVINTNGTGSLTVSKSSVDSVALGTILQAVASKAP